MRRGAGELSWRSVRRGLSGSSNTSARRLDRVAAGTVLSGSRRVWHDRGVLCGRYNGDRVLGDVDDLNGGRRAWDLLLLGHIVAGSVVRHVISWRLGLVTTVAWAGWLSGHGRNDGNVGGRSDGLGDGVSDDSWATLVADVDRGD